MTAHGSTPTARKAVPRSLDLGDALPVILEALEGPTGELGEAVAVSMIRSGERAHVTALVRTARYPGRTIVHRGSIGPDWSTGGGGRLALKWGPMTEITDTTP